MDMPSMLTFLQFIFTVGALIWGAAVISARVKEHDKVMVDLTRELRNVGLVVHQIDKRVAVLEERSKYRELFVSEERISDAEKY